MMFFGWYAMCYIHVIDEFERHVTKDSCYTASSHGISMQHLLKGSFRLNSEFDKDKSIQLTSKYHFAVTQCFNFKTFI